MQTTERFTNRVEDYVRFRPAYPKQILGMLRNECGLVQTSTVADVGSGTGILARLFCEFGCAVYGVEPNQAMREAGEQYLRDYPNFTSVNGTAEATTLGGTSMDFITAGQAFHWFDMQNARHEFLRILKPNGWTVLVWNDRKIAGSAFGEAYEALMERHGTDYAQASLQAKLSSGALARFFGHSEFRRAAFDNPQTFDRESLLGRVLSASYMPKPDQPGHDEMVRGVNALFDQFQTRGTVTMDQQTKVWYGQMV